MFRKLNHIFALCISLCIMHAVAAQTQGFEYLHEIDDAMLNGEEIWKEHPSDSEAQYATVAKRADGMFLVIKREPNMFNPKKTAFAGYLMKCGVHKDWPVYFKDAASLKAALNNPGIDAPGAAMMINEGSMIGDLYSQLCE